MQRKLESVRGLCRGCGRYPQSCPEDEDAPPGTDKAVLMAVGAVLLGVMVERPWRFPMETSGWDNLHQSVGHSSVLWGRVLSSPATYGQDGGQWTERY